MKHRSFLTIAVALASFSGPVFGQTSVALRSSLAFFHTEQVSNEFDAVGGSRRVPVNASVNLVAYRQLGRHWELGAGFGQTLMFWGVLLEDLPIASVAATLGSSTAIEPALTSATLRRVSFQEKMWSVPLSVRFDPFRKPGDWGRFYLSIDGLGLFLHKATASAQFHQYVVHSDDIIPYSLHEDVRPALAPEVEAYFQQKVARQAFLVAPGVGYELRVFSGPVWLTAEASYQHFLIAPHPFVKPPIGFGAGLGIRVAF